MKIVMVSAETLPFAKTGGLADAVPALAEALGKRGHEVNILMPRYDTVDRNRLEKRPETLGVPMGSGEMWCALYRTTLPGSEVPVWMLDREDLYGRDGLYGPDGSSSWPDNALRYGFLSAAVFQFSRCLGGIPDVLHLHDWPAAPAAWILDSVERGRDFRNTASVVTIHNLGYQGIFHPSELSVFAPPLRSRGDTMIHEKSMNFLAGGLKAADAITTVSPTYAREILEPDFCEGLGEILNSRWEHITGILNGMDYNAWNPATDQTVRPHNYGRYTLGRKIEVKKRLQKETGLQVNPNIPLFGMIARLTGQKGIDLINHPGSPALRMFRDGQAQLVVLGTGERRYEEGLRKVGKAYPRRCGVRIGFSGPCSRLIEAGSDFFLMPSRYEPCGLNQMYSLRYGTLPIARKTGGLADTVIDIDQDTKRGNGFLFDNPDARELGRAIHRAVALYADRRRMTRVRRRAMALRFDWESAAAEYEIVYRRSRR